MKTMNQLSYHIFIKKSFFYLVSLFYCITFLIACAEKKIEPPKEKKEIVREVTIEPVDHFNLFLGDKKDKLSLINAIEKSLIYFDKVKDKDTYQYGHEEYSYQEVQQSMRLFLELLKIYDDKERFLAEFKKHFNIHKSPGSEDDGLVLYTGYFEPIIGASRVKNDRFTIPAYALPSDLKVLKLRSFRKSLKNDSIVYRLNQGEIVPYFTRKEILAGALDQSAKPIVWFESHIDLFFLQIQGSGIIRLQNGEQIALSYAGANGRAYSSIGKLLVEKEVFKLEEVSMQSLIQYLKDNADKQEEVLNHNESYTFFTENKPNTGPIGSINVNLTPERSLATDYRIYPKGALMYIQTTAPNCDDQGHCDGVMPVDQFIVNQDTGGAIRTFARADVFWGRGERAKSIAGRMRSKGDLYLIIAKKSSLQKLPENSISLK